MTMIATLAQLVVSQWIWFVIYGIYHPVVNGMLMVPLLMYLARKKLLFSLVYAVSSQGFAIMSLGLVARIMLDYLGNASCNDQVFMTLHPLAASLLLGGMYICMQALFFYLTCCMWNISFKTFAVIVCLSNLMAALIVFRFVPVL